jgi:hypothetical protein
MRANVTTRFPWVPESGWPLPLAKPMGWQNGVKCPQKGAKWRLLREYATLPVMTQLFYCQSVVLIVVETSAARQLATTIYSLRTCIENLGFQNFKKAQKRSFS